MYWNYRLLRLWQYIAKYVYGLVLNIRCVILPAVYCRPFVSKEVFGVVSKDFEFVLYVFLLLTPLL